MDVGDDDGAFRRGEERTWRQVWHGVVKWFGLSTASDASEGVTKFDSGYLEAENLNGRFTVRRDVPNFEVGTADVWNKE